MLSLIFNLAYAGVYASIATPASTGSFSSVTEKDILGLGFNPASVASGRREISLDVGLLMFSIDNTLAGPEQGVCRPRGGHFLDAVHIVR